MDVIERINAEIQKKPDDRYTEIIGQYVIDRCAAPEARKSVTSAKTLQGAMSAVYKLAQSKKQGATAVLTPGEVFGEVDRYFGFPSDEAAQWKAVGMTVPKAKERPARMSLDLDDLW